MRNIRDQRLPQSSGYDTLFGPSPLARAITQTQAAKISEGSTLEKTIAQQASFVLDLSVPENLAGLLSNTLTPQALPYVVNKASIKKFLWPALMSKQMPCWSTLPKATQAELMQKHFLHEPDMLVVDVVNQVTHFVELKSFCVFDTEKSSAIAEKIKVMPSKYDLPYKAKGLAVCFYASSRKHIVEGMKKRVKSTQVMTGEDFLKMISQTSVASMMGLTQGSHADNVLFVLEKALESASSVNPNDLKAVLEKFPNIQALLRQE